MKKYIPLARNGKGQYKCLDTENLCYKNIGPNEIDQIQDYVNNSGIHRRQDGGQIIRPLKAINGIKAMKVFLGYDSESQKYIVADLSTAKPSKKYFDEADIYGFIKNKIICNIELQPDGTIDAAQQNINKYITYQTEKGEVHILSNEIAQYCSADGFINDIEGFSAFLENKMLEVYGSMEKQPFSVPAVKPEMHSTEKVPLSRELGLDDEFFTTKREIFQQMLFTIGPQEVVRVPLEVLKGLNVKWLLTLDDKDYSKVKVNAEHSFNNLSYLLTHEVDYPHDIAYIATIQEQHFKKLFILNRAGHHENSMVRALCMSDWLEGGVTEAELEMLRRNYRQWRKEHYCNFL